MKVVRKSLALLIWLICYVPTSLVVMGVMASVVAQRRGGPHA